LIKPSNKTVAQEEHYFKLCCKEVPKNILKFGTLLYKQCHS